MRRRSAIVLAFICTIALTANAFAMTALETLKYKQTVIAKAQDALKAAPGDSAAQRALDRAVRDTFDFDTLARRSIGDHWDEMTPDQRREYLRLFRSLVLKSTIRKLEEYRAEKTDYTEVDVDSTDAVITTIVTATSGDQVAIRYKMDRKDGRWWVWDTTIGLDTEITEYDVSTADNYRSAFNKLVSDEGIDGLLGKLREKEGGGGDL